MGRTSLDKSQVSPLPFPDRRRGPRRRPTYTPDEIAALRIERVQIRRNSLFCLLSDGNLLYTPLNVSPALAESPPWALYQWQVIQDGEAVEWNTGVLTKHLDLVTLLAHPEAKVSALAL